MKTANMIAIAAIVSTICASPGISHSQTVERGKAIFNTLAKKYPEMNPFAFGLATPNPVLALAIPEKEWKKLSKTDQVSLTFYMESLISDARSAPEKYIDTPRHAPIYSIDLAKVANLCSDCWAIGVGQLYKNKRGAEYGETVVQGDSAWEKSLSGIEYRGIKASEFRRGFSQRAEIATTKTERAEDAPSAGAAGAEKRFAGDVFKARLESFNQLQSTEVWRKNIHAGIAQEGKKITFFVTDRWHLLSRDMKEAYVKESWMWFLQVGRMANIPEKPDDYSLEVRHNQSNRLLATWDALWGFKLKE